MVAIVEGMEDRILEASVAGYGKQDTIASAEGSHRYLCKEPRKLAFNKSELSNRN
jgi:hypothetical protein